MTNNIENKEMGWNLHNSYLDLPKMFYSRINLNPVDSPKLVIFNDELANDLGLNSKALKSKDGIEILAGNKTVEEEACIAQAYAGHQFGYFTMLGDGRALLIGEQITPNNERYDIQLKGSGRTPYSRSGDGRAALGPMLREYIISEAMNGLGIPTTRSLAVVKTGEKIFRGEYEIGAILTRVASSHIRFGTFQYAYNNGGKEKVKALADYSINRHYPKIKDDKDKYLKFLEEVINAHAYLVAKWQAVGFIHGVMNTDNMTISGETIDYGPCAFMDIYNPETVFSSIDQNGRYAYNNQPTMAHWNLCRFAETLIELLDENKEKAIEIAQGAISTFPRIFSSYWLLNMKNKLGIFNEEDDDRELIEDLLILMEKYKEDFTNTFLVLTFGKDSDSEMFNSEEYKIWKKSYEERLKRQPQSKELVLDLMKKSNPAVIPRNHRVEEALDFANKGDFSIMNKLLGVISSPYEHSIAQEEYSKLPKQSSCPYKTYCGT
ncbi:MAG: protein adenylyltransferase SelO [Peptostreptococcaceae bacterium]